MMATSSSQHARAIAGVLWIAAPLWYLLCEAVTAAGFPGYNYADFYISDLGVSEHGMFQGRELASQIPQVMNAGLIGAGLLFAAGLLALLLSTKRTRSVTLLAIFGVLYAVGIVFVGLVDVIRCPK